MLSLLFIYVGVNAFYITKMYTRKNKEKNSMLKTGYVSRFESHWQKTIVT